MSVSVVGGSTVARGSSEAALLSEDESDCIDWERCLFLLVDATSSSPALLDGDAAGDGRLIAVKIKSHPGGSHRLVIEGGVGGVANIPTHGETLVQRTRVSRPRRAQGPRRPQLTARRRRP